MIRSRLGLKALGLSVLVLGLMAFVTGGVAQATTGATWTYENGGNLLAFTEGLLPVLNASINGASASLHFTTAGKTEVEFKCTAFTIAGSPKLLLNGSISNGKAAFTGCQTYLNLSATPSGNCLPKTSGATNKDEIITEEVHGLLVLHTLGDGKKHHVVLLLPLKTDKEGKPLAATVELGESCAIGESVPITGHLVVWDIPPATALQHLATHVIQEFPALRTLRALGQPALVLGSANAFLTGEHVNYKWAGLTP